MKHEFLAKSTKGKLHIINRKGFDELLLSELDGKDLILTVEHKRAKRSDNQNRYYFGAVVPIIQSAFKELGYRLNKDEVHEFLKNKFLQEDMITSDAVYIGAKTRSTASLNKNEFGDYIAEIAQWAAEILNTIVPEPLEQTKIEYSN